MRDFIIAALPWLLSAITIWMTVLAGNKHPLAWAVGLGNQALWLVWILVSASWGLLPMNLALWVVYGRNHLKWRAKPATAEAPPFACGASEDVELWRQIDNLFVKHGEEPPPGRLRDELVGHLLWARYGARLDREVRK